MSEPSIGIMEGAFFVSKNEILNWVNELLLLGTGAVYCQIIDILFPGKVSLGKVSWKARNEWEFINNFKILQQAFIRCNIKKHIEVEKLSKAKYQDNLEFAQWMKRFYDLNVINKKIDVTEYNAIAKRGNNDVDFGFTELKSKKKKPLDERKSKMEEDFEKIKKHKPKKRSLSKSPFCNASISNEKNEKRTILPNSKKKYSNDNILVKDKKEENNENKKKLKSGSFSFRMKGQNEAVQFYKEKIIEIFNLLKNVNLTIQEEEKDKETEPQEPSEKNELEKENDLLIEKKIDLLKENSFLKENLTKIEEIVSAALKIPNLNLSHDNIL